MKLDDENLDPSRPLECKEIDLSKISFTKEVLEDIKFSAWEACARSYGHQNEVEMRRKYLEWKFMDTDE